MHPLTGISIRGGDEMNPIVHFVAAFFVYGKYRYLCSGAQAFIKEL